MGVISTRELLDKYYESVEGYAATTRKRIDVKELYEYESEIGKELIDMNADELFGLILKLPCNKRKGKEIDYMISHYSYDQLATAFRAIFNFYIENYQPIVNPFNTKKMKGIAATKRLSQGRKPFVWADVEEIIRKLHRDFEPERADYIELILLLFYNGFAKAEEIVTLKEDMINHYSKTVKLPGRTIRLSDRCHELLVKINKMETIPGWRGDYIAASWNGSYFKFIIRPSQEYKLNDRTLSEMCNIINRCIANYVNDKYDTKVNYRFLYLLGLYQYIVGKHGVKKTNDMLLSFRDLDYADELMELMNEYGVQGFNNVTHLKRQLRPFITTEEE